MEMSADIDVRTTTTLPLPGYEVWSGTLNLDGFTVGGLSKQKYGL